MGDQGIKEPRSSGYLSLCTLCSFMASEPGVSNQAEKGGHEACQHGKGELTDEGMH